MVETIIIKSNSFATYFRVISIYIEITSSVIMIDSTALTKASNTNKHTTVKLDRPHKDDKGVCCFNLLEYKC